MYFNNGSKMAGSCLQMKSSLNQTQLLHRSKGLIAI